MKMAKRALAVVLSLVMAFSVFSIVGSAAMNTATVYEGSDETLTQGIDIFKVVDGTPVETELTSGSNLEPGDVVEVRVKLGTDFTAATVSTHICYDSTIFTPYKDGAVYTTASTVNFGEATNFFKTYDDVADVDGYTLWQVLNPDDKVGRAGAVNTRTSAATAAQKTVARNQYTPLSWKEGGKTTGAILAEYDNFHFVSVKFVCGTDAEAGGKLIAIPYDTYFSFQLQVLEGAETAEGATTSIWIPYDAIKTTTKQSCHRVAADIADTDDFTTATLTSAGYSVDLSDGEVEFTIGAGAVEPAKQYTVTFVAGDNGALVGTTEVTVDEGTAFADIALPTAVADAGYKFAGWTNAPETITGDVTVTANFEYDASKWVTVTFAAGENGSIADAEAITIIKGTGAEGIAYPEATADAGYKFVGWDLTGTIEADVTATAIFEYDASQWATVAFAAGANGSIADAEAVTVLKGTDASAIEFPAATADAGYKFAGWDLTGAINADVTATANFELDASQWATVTFAAGANGALAGTTEVTVLKGTAWADITFPEATADAGYAFAGWDNVGETVEGDVTVTASFTATDATVTVNVYTMDTTGAYGAASTTTFTATVGGEASVNAADYESEGFYVDTEKSLLAVESVSANGATLEVYVARTVATYTFLVPDGDAYVQYDQDEYFYGATVVVPAAPTIDGYEFKNWAVDGVAYTGGTAGTSDIEVKAVYEVVDSTLTEEDLAALADAIKLLPDPENLYYYTDEAILMVAAALGSDETDADAYIAAATAATTYEYEGEQSKAAVAAATKAITEIASTINSWVDGKMPYRDESKANINIDVIPSAINGEEVTPDENNKVVVKAGDIVTFDFNLTTDYYLSALYAQILYDTTLFDIVDVDDYEYTEEQIQDGEAYADYILDTTTDRNISRNYDIACESLNSYDKQYHASVKNDEAFKEQYKIILVSVMTKAQTASKVFKFDDEYIASFRLKAVEDVVYDGSTITPVGVRADWYIDADHKDELLAGTRAVGFKADGKTIANAGTTVTTNFFIYDNAAQYGQTFTSTMANVQFGEAAAPVKQYTVTFVAGDNGAIEGTTEVTVDEGTAFADIALPKTVADAGYKFVEWANAPETITGDVTVTATFEYDAEQWATVTFAAGDNGSIADAEAVTVLKGTDASEIEFPEATADAGYKFAGWDLTGAIEADVTATADFEYDAEQWATVTFAAGDNGSIADAEAVTVLKGTDASEITFPEATADAGYKFAGWDLTGAIEADVTATATFEYDDAQWTLLVFVAGDNGSIEGGVSDIHVLKGTPWTDIEFPKATADAGYKFVGWDNVGEGTSFDVETVTANFEYDAEQWATVTFVAGDNGALVHGEQVTVLKGTAWADITFPETVADAGYKFAAWDYEGDTVESDATATATFVVDNDQYATVTFAAGENGSIADAEAIEVLKGTAWADITFPEATADKGYKFAGWDNEGETVTGDVTVTANFEYDAEQWATVTFAAGDNGSIADAQAVTVLKGTDASEIEFPEATADAGYKFAGWDLTGAIEADVTATANFEYDAEQWATVTFAAGENGSIADAEAVTVLKGTSIDAIEFPEATADQGYEFAGWDYEGDTIEADVTITAIFEEIDTSADVLWAGYEDTSAILEAGEMPAAEAETIYAIVKIKDVAPIKVQIRNAADNGTITYTREHSAVKSITEVTYLGKACELWVIDRALPAGDYIAIAKYINSMSIADISNELGAEFAVEAEIPVYDNDVFSAEIANAGEYDGVTEQVITIKTGLDVTKVQLLNNVDNGTMTFAKTAANVTVEEVDGQLVWTIKKIFAVGEYSFSVFAASVEGWADSDKDIDFAITAKKVVVENNAPVVSVALDGAVPTVTVTTSANARKVKFTNTADNGTMTFSSTSSAVTIVENEDGTLTWTIVLSAHSAKEFSYNVTALVGSSYSEATNVTFTVAK